MRRLLCFEREDLGPLGPTRVSAVTIRVPRTPRSRKALFERILNLAAGHNALAVWTEN